MATIITAPPAFTRTPTGRRLPELDDLLNFFKNHDETQWIVLDEVAPHTATHRFQSRSRNYREAVGDELGITIRSRQYLDAEITDPEVLDDDGNPTPVLRLAFAIKRDKDTGNPLPYEEPADSDGTPQTIG